MCKESLQRDLFSMHSDIIGSAAFFNKVDKHWGFGASRSLLKCIAEFGHFDHLDGNDNSHLNAWLDLQRCISEYARVTTKKVTITEPATVDDDGQVIPEESWEQEVNVVSIVIREGSGRYTCKTNADYYESAYDSHWFTDECTWTIEQSKLNKG